MKRFVVVGLGNFGSGVASALHQVGHEVAALDLDEKLVDRVAPDVTLAAVGDGTDLKTLEKVGAREADAAVVSTGDDITASVLTTLALRDCGVSRIYAKVVSTSHARVMEKLGVTETVFPERDSALHLARRISSRLLLGYVELGPGLFAQEMAVPEEWEGKSLRELALPRRHRVSVVAVRDALTGVVEVIPDADSPLKTSQSLLVAGEEDALARVVTLP